LSTGVIVVSGLCDFILCFSVWFDVPQLSAQVVSLLILSNTR